jgi:glucokinase
MPEITVGIDLGGTKIYAITVDSAGAILSRSKKSTRPELGMQGVAERMREAATAALGDAGADWDAVGRVGVAVPTSVDPETGDALHAPALGWKDQPVRSVFRDVFDHEVYLENDVNCGTLGEYRAGAAQGYDTVVGFFLGTGLGGGIIIDGRLRRGRRGSAGELGHMIVKVDGKRCGCGNRGCLEAYCSKTAFCKAFDKKINRKGYKSVLGKLTGNDFSSIKSNKLAQAYREGDPITQQILHRGARMLGVATSSIVAALSPDVVVYGGGVMEAMGEELMPVIRDGMEETLFALKPEDVNLQLSTLGDDAVAMGAAFLAMAGGDV